MKYFLIVLSLILLLLSLFVGQIALDMANIFNTQSMDYKILMELRLPRTIGAFLAGGVLALGGMLFQSIFRNALASPYTLGVASGASFGVGVAVVLGYTTLSYLFGFVGAISTVLIHLAFSMRVKYYDKDSMLLIGIAMSFFYSAMLMVLLYLSDLKQSYEIVRFTMGSLDIVPSSVWMLLLSALVILAIAKLYKRDIQLMLVSYNYALLKGVNIAKSSYILLSIVSVAIGIVVTIAGPIGFVGLIIPHIIKQIYQQSADKLVFEIFFYGGIFLVVCDMLSRSLHTGANIPIGVVTSIIGVPIFIYLIIKR
ncbi:MAG: iron ABC transporter permease [Campylobacterales bacterium]|nr:iron ABC transporter permease [Campylobacterales bacterium]